MTTHQYFQLGITIYLLSAMICYWLLEDEVNTAKKESSDWAHNALDIARLVMSLVPFYNTWIVIVETFRWCRFWFKMISVLILLNPTAKRQGYRNSWHMIFGDKKPKKDEQA
jgi:cytochrome b561